MSLYCSYLNQFYFPGWAAGWAPWWWWEWVLNAQTWLPDVITHGSSSFCCCRDRLLPENIVFLCLFFSFFWVYPQFLCLSKSNWVLEGFFFLAVYPNFFTLCDKHEVSFTSEGVLICRKHIFLLELSEIGLCWANAYSCYLLHSLCLISGAFGGPNASFWSL